MTDTIVRLNVGGVSKVELLIVVGDKTRVKISKLITKCGWCCNFS